MVPIICIVLYSRTFSPVFLLAILSWMSFQLIMPWELGMRSAAIYIFASLHHCGCIISCFDIFLHSLSSGRFTTILNWPNFFIKFYHQILLTTILNWPAPDVSLRMVYVLCFYFVSWCVSFGTKGCLWKICCVILCNWPSTMVLSRWSLIVSIFLLNGGKYTQV